MLSKTSAMAPWITQEHSELGASAPGALGHNGAHSCLAEGHLEVPQIPAFCSNYYPK